jgi:hypothetical protein
VLSVLITMAFAGGAGAFAAVVVRKVWLPDYRRSLRLPPIWGTSRTTGPRMSRGGR